ncbi:MAG: hypothetical protein HYW48_06555 [Deltaproteobacteria bacterium]|nr:hypothetical protein [Deltaproteobacteria bacterium]
MNKQIYLANIPLRTSSPWRRRKKLRLVVIGLGHLLADLAKELEASR